MSADALTTTALKRPAIIGKLPGHGDFIARGFDHALREPFDRWMNEWMSHARSVSGVQFEEHYQLAAPWLLETPSSAALLMPSVDAVGRLYPLLIVCEAGVIMQEIYDQVIEALTGSISGDALRDQLATLEPGEIVRNAQGWFLPEGAEPLLPPPDSVAAWQEVGRHLL